MNGLRLWDRDECVLRETARSPLLASQVAALCAFSTVKKASARCATLHRAGLVERVGVWQRGMQGRAPFAYFRGRAPAAISLPHTLGVAEFAVQAVRSFTGEFVAQFFYGHEVRMGGGLRPDGVLVVSRREKTALTFLEDDRGTERRTSPSSSSYSLLGKLRSYDQYSLSGQCTDDFSWAGNTVGFRVGLVLSSSQRLFTEHITPPIGSFGKPRRHMEHSRHFSTRKKHAQTRTYRHTSPLESTHTFQNFVLGNCSA